MKSTHRQRQNLLDRLILLAVKEDLRIQGWNTEGLLSTLKDIQKITEKEK